MPVGFVAQINDDFLKGQVFGSKSPSGATHERTKIVRVESDVVLVGFRLGVVTAGPHKPVQSLEFGLGLLD